MHFIKKTFLNDILLILSLLAAALVVWVIITAAKEGGAEAVVTVNGKETMRLSLYEDTIVKIGDDEHYNMLVIRDGEAFVSEASCPDKTCVNMGRIRNDKESVICLPNKVIISIEGKTSAGPDAVAD